MELLVRVIDKPRTGKASVDKRRTMAGDVIVACQDGHAWSERERTNPNWRIVRIPDIAAPEDINDPAAILLYDEYGLKLQDAVKNNKKRPEIKPKNNTFHKRGCRLNLPNLPSVARSTIGPDLDLSAGDLLLAVEGKP